MVKLLWLYMIMFPGELRCLSFTSVGSTYDDNIFECNSNASLVCRTEKGRDSIMLSINNTPVVRCVTDCIVNTTVLGNYTVSHVFDAMVIHLDIHKVSVADSSNVFTCEGDSKSLSIKPVIEVSLKKSSTNLMVTGVNNTNTIEIKVTTGCVRLTSNISFVWNKTKTSNGSIIEPLSEEDFIQNSTIVVEDSSCIPSYQCGGAAHASSLTFSEQSNGGVDYFITCTIVTDGNVPENNRINYTVISDRSFSLKGEIMNSEPIVRRCDVGCIIGVVIGLETVVIVVIVVLWRKYRRKHAGYRVTPPKFEIIKVTENSFLLYLTPGLNRNYSRNFALEYTNTQTGRTNSVNIIVEPAAPIPFEYLLKSLSAGTEYELTLYETQLRGDSGKAGPLKQTTFGLPHAPLNFQCSAITETTVTLEWKPGKYRKYRQTFVIRYRPKGQGNKLWTVVRLEDEDKPTIQYNVDKFTTGTTYEFEIHAENEIGKSQTLNISIETKGKPESPTDFQEVESARTSTSITIEWIPGQYRRDTQVFVINCKREGKGMKHMKIPDDGSQKMVYVIENLRAGKSYQITIKAVNHLGSTPTSNTLSVKTRDEIAETEL